MAVKNNKEIVCGIYKITSPIGNIYVGRSINIYRRWYSYYSLNCKCQVQLYKSLKKHGSKKHKYEIIEVCKKEDLSRLEDHYINLNDCLGVNGLNSSYSGKFSVSKKIDLEKLEKKRKYNREYSKRKNKENMMSDEEMFEYFDKHGDKLDLLKDIELVDNIDDLDFKDIPF